MPEYPDLSGWSEGDTDSPELSERDRIAREKLASLDPRKDGFHLNPHIVWDRAADGSVTMSVPWSDFRYSVPADTPYVEACIGFADAYDEVLKSKDEFDRFNQVMRDHGVIPLSERP